MAETPRATSHIVDSAPERTICQEQTMTPAPQERMVWYWSTVEKA